MNLMTLKHKKEELSTQIRKMDHQAYFKKIRMSLQLAQTTQERINEQTFIKVQPEQILEAIRGFKKQQQPINFAMINEYTIATTQPFSQIICEELANVVFDSFRENGDAIAALANALSKKTQAHFLNNINNLSDKIMQVLDENMTGEGKIKHGPAIGYLIYNILQFSQNKEDFYYLPKYYEVFASSKGYFDRILLIVLYASSSCRQLLPPKTYLKDMLSSQIQYSELQPLDFKIVCQFLHNYVCFELDLQLYVYLIKWITKRLKQRKFPLSLKATLIKICTIMFSYEFVANYANQNEDINFDAIQEIIEITRFGMAQTKTQAINCLCKYLENINAQKLKNYVENTHLFQAIFYSLELSLSAQEYFKLLTSISLIFCIDEKYYKTAEKLGIKPLLYRFFSCKVVKVATMAKEMLELFHTYN